MTTALAESSTSKPEVMPDVTLDSRIEWLVEIMKMPGERVLSESIELWPNLQRDAWRMSFYLKRIKDDELWRPYGSFSEWAEKVLGRSSAYASKYLTGARFVLEDCQTDEERRQAMCATPLQIAEAGIHKLAKTDKAEALKLASSGKTTRELSQAVKARDADGHHETGPVRNFHLNAIPIASYRALMEVWNVLLFNCRSGQATDGEIAMYLREEFFGSYDHENQGLFAPYSADIERIAEGKIQAEDAELIATIAGFLRGRAVYFHDPQFAKHFPLEEIMAGHVKCIETGCTNPNELESHHTVPRSQQGHDSPQVWLRRDVHERLTRNWEGEGWWPCLKGWMKRRDLVWLKEREQLWVGARLEAKLHVPGQLVGYFGLREGEVGSA